MLYAGLDLSRKRLDVHLLEESGATKEVTAVSPDGDALRTLVASIARHGEPVRAAIESMNGARFVHDSPELAGWDVDIADAQKVKGSAPLACKTDRIDAWVLAELARRDLVPAIWLPTPGVRAERERARFRLHLVRHRTALKNRIHATLIAFGHPCPVSDLFGTAGRELLHRMEVPEPWAGTVAASLELIEDLDERIHRCEKDLRALGADHPYVPRLMTVAPAAARPRRSCGGSSPRSVMSRDRRSAARPPRELAPFEVAGQLPVRQDAVVEDALLLPGRVQEVLERQRRSLRNRAASFLVLPGWPNLTSTH
jgi:transposase